MNESSVCSISLKSNEAKLLRKTTLIIWDEIMMSHVDQVNCVDRSLRDILKVDKPFGGIPIVFAGDPRHIFPVVHHGDKSKIVNAYIHSSPLWNEIQKLKLTVNMRVAADEIDFAAYLLEIGNGTVQLHSEVGEDIIQIPNEYLVSTVDELVKKVFPNINEGYTDKYYAARNAILTPKNENVDNINELIIDRFPGKGTTYLSADTVSVKMTHTMSIQLNFSTQ